ncbi:MAG: TonB-dependent receptor [Candidatus Solibacter usitatus]|nr:TonB-dependent receptor [Candidatus Solibacter usitatus]
MLLLLLCLSQEPRATVRIEIGSAEGPVEGAMVVINGTPMQTGRDGVAEVSIPPGKLMVSVRKDGFFPATASYNVEEARLWKFSMELHPATKVEEEITVYATRSGQRLQDSALRVEVLTEEEIAEKTLMTPGDIVMLLNETGGLRAQTTSPSLGAASVRIQGMRGRYTHFLRDGLPLSGQQGSGFGLLQIPPMDLGQVEVIKGVSSALYGAGAMGGVVNLISRRPQQEPVYDFLINRSTLGATDGLLFAAGRFSKRWSASLLGGGHTQELRDVDKDGWADLPSYERAVARPRLHWDGGEGRNGLLTAGVTYENRAGGTMPGAVLPAAGTAYRETLDTRHYDVGASFQSLLHGRYVITARASASSQTHTHVFGEVSERDRHELVFGEVTARGSAGRNTWVAGIAAERDKYVPREVSRFAYQYTTPGIILQDDIAIAPWLSIAASARADFHTRYGTFVSPRFSALLRRMGWTARLSAGQGFYAPTPLTEETEAAGLSRLVIPKPLQPERGRSAAADLTRFMGPLSATVTVFRSSIRNPVSVERGTRYELANLPRPTDNAGVEMLATLRKAPFAATASYTYVQALESVSGVRRDVPLTPRHTFGITGMWEKELHRIGIECYYTGRQSLEHNPYRGASQPYVILGFLGERKVRRLRLFINVENITNVRQTRWDSLLRPARAVDGRWSVDAWAPLDGRVFNGGVRLRF